MACLPGATTMSRAAAASASCGGLLNHGRAHRHRGAAVVAPVSTLLLAIAALALNLAVLVFVLKTRKHNREMERLSQQLRSETDEMIAKFREETKL